MHNRWRKSKRLTPKRRRPRKPIIRRNSAALSVSDAVGAANDASKLARNLFTFFFTAGLYIAVIIGGTTHEDLFLETPITLPILGAPLPITGFYAVVPAIFLLLHINLLLKLHLLRDKLHRLCNRLPNEAARDLFRDRLFPYDFSVLVIGARRQWGARIVIHFIVAVTVFIGPLLLLLFVQAQFLPYQDQQTTWIHRGLVTADLAAVLWFLWGFRWAGTDRGDESPKAKTVQRFGGAIATPVALSFLLAAFALAPAWFLYRFDKDYFLLPPARYAVCKDVVDARMFADDAEALKRAITENRRQQRKARCEHRRDESATMSEEFSATIRDNQSRKFQFLPFPPIATALNLREGVFWNARDIPINVLEAAFGHQLQNSNEDVWDRQWVLIKNFDRRDLRNADFLGAELPYASFREASLRGTDFYGARLRGADFSIVPDEKSAMRGLGADLTAARFYNADLTKANFLLADLTGAVFDHATLIGAAFAMADLTKGQLSYADLTGADIGSADLTKAQLLVVNLTGANFFLANLTGADLHSAKLIGANLDKARLLGANVWGAETTDVFARCTIFTAATIHFSRNSKRLVLSGSYFAGLKQAKSLERGKCDYMLNAYSIAGAIADAIAELREDPPEWINENWNFDNGLPPATFYHGLIDVLPNIACHHADWPAIGPDGAPLDIPVCGEGASKDWYKVWECNWLQRTGMDPWTRKGDPFEANETSCAGIATVDEEDKRKQ